MRQSKRLAVVLVCLLASGTTAYYQAQSVPAMTTTVNAFLASLSSAQRNQATFEFSDEERLNWHFIPRVRNGLPLKEMEPYQRQFAQGMLVSGLSQSGYIKATTIMSLEKVLYELEGGRRTRDPEDYYFSVFGTPSDTGTWAWRVEGHHLSVNFSIDGGKVASSTPSFFGANPAEVKEGPLKGLRPLGREEDLGRELLAALDSSQRQSVMIATEAPDDILMRPEQSEPEPPKGVAAADMTPDQREMLFNIVREYTSNMSPEEAAKAVETIREAGVDQIHFAWAGSNMRGEGHYYRVQGPTFIIEYDNIQNSANHIHSVWRDLTNDFGADLLSMHYKASHRRAE